LALSRRPRAFSACVARTDSIIDGAPYTADPARAAAAKLRNCPKVRSKKVPEEAER
jgi:hypothetical protein